MTLGEIGFLLALLVVYGGTIFGLFMGSCRIGAPASVALVGGFTLFGIGSGLAVALVWPSEGVVLVNPLSLRAGDELYTLFINHLGDPHSSQAHYTITWLLRVPQVYVPASAAVWGFLGAIAQAIHNGVNHLMMDWRAAGWQAAVLGVLTGVCLIVVHVQGYSDGHWRSSAIPSASDPRSCHESFGLDRRSGCCRNPEESG